MRHLRHHLTALRNWADQVGWPLALALAGCVAAALFALLINILWLSRSEAQLQRVIDARDRIELLREVDHAVARAESAQRGFLIQGDARYLAPYQDRVTRLRDVLARLQQSIARHEESEARLGDPVRRLAVTVGEKLSEMDVTINLARDGNLAQAHDVLNTRVGLQKGIKISSSIDALIHFEQQNLIEQRKARVMLLNVLRLSLLATTALVLLCVILMLRRVLRDTAQNRREQQQLLQHQSELDSLVKQRTSEMEQLALDYQLDVERERYRLARELHDELGAVLTATKIDLYWVQRQVQDQHPAIADKLAKTQRNLDHGIQFKRQLVLDLHPSLLSTFGLIAATRTLAEDAAARGNWALTLNLPDENNNDINEVQGLIVYRVVQETLNNAVKYSHATELSLSLLVDTDYLKLEIADNGVGMDLNRLPEGTYGISGMHRRVTAIGGKITIASAPGDGVFLCALIPRTLQAEHQAERRLFG
ncbi:CHASE3 domain-containing protein [Chitinolyticbacter albus]|uniref:CHASE3 domain-containing protein n=1 Tax=Chitinolyticbacter albus TaxID=2961951 RepID=UPI00210890DC|nr:CHASE3 domain-containing protein [Chitinolyticbacter albus]